MQNIPVHKKEMPDGSLKCVNVQEISNDNIDQFDFDVKYFSKMLPKLDEKVFIHYRDCSGCWGKKIVSSRLAWAM